ncbi:HPr kinase/phosphorylase [Roseinatronobacter bogoriensis]|uniref:HPr kinase/phosphorylase n=1 Tax=Roseinatronobacter bogoriensis TaxID=119542 RepID=UPI000A6DD0A4|nr:MULTISPECIES: hypothetical protein [Rhodobaca]MBB4208171.1 HPr kinase/phosphorylase [Rhodobaca bogoriensis DSM 18756]TDW38812.1 Hpr(Ser) kinase/phosphatase [Rhodobaca barguzinensis]TDY69150.1 Hpr(Ser) kinase/phosphatase [Rhodobaca bogoriensis DSM 18756]
MTLVIAADRIHSSAVAFEVEGQSAGVLILGRSGSGKSELALELMAIGAVLVSDDQTLLRRDGASIIAQAPPTIRGLIEMRGLGILRARVLDTAKLVAVVNLDETEAQRLPERVFADVLGVQLPCLRNCASSAFPAGLKQYILSQVLQYGQGAGP